MLKRIHGGWLPALIAAVLVASCPAYAEYPDKPLRLIVPFPPGGGTEPVARVLSQKLAEALGHQVVVDNRPGAGTTIGVGIVAKSPPDGYTLLLGSIANAISAILYNKLNYDLLRDFTHITLLATTPGVLVVHPAVPVKSVKELIAFADAKERLDNMGLQVRVSTPEEYAAFTRIEIEKWKKVVKAADIRAD